MNKRIAGINFGKIFTITEPNPTYPNSSWEYFCYTGITQFGKKKKLTEPQLDCDFGETLDRGPQFDYSSIECSLTITDHS